MLAQPHFTEGETEHKLKSRTEPLHPTPGLLTSSSVNIKDLLSCSHWGPSVGWSPPTGILGAVETRGSALGLPPTFLLGL